MGNAGFGVQWVCVCARWVGLIMPLCVVVHLQYENSGNVNVVFLALCVCVFV